MAESVLETLLVNYRWVLVCLFLLPASFIYNLVYSIRSKIVFFVNSAPGSHHAKVANVQRQVQEWNKSGRRTKMCTARPGWQTICFRRPVYKETLHKIDCNLIDILNIDTEKKVVRVEPMVTMGQLSKTLLKLGWTIPVVPELDDLTVGGLVMGTGIESSSHRFGLFQHICVQYELVLSDGALIKCSENENSDLFYTVPWSYGTLGFLTSVDIKIVPATKFIKLNYQPCTGLPEIVENFKIASENVDKNNFVECLLYNADEGVIMTGEMVPDDKVNPEKINKIGRWYKPWFFRHVENIFKQKWDIVEYIPIKDYYHRHSKSLFWELQDIVPFGNNIFFRFFLGWMMPIKISLLKLTQTETVKKLYENNHVIQDMLVPVYEMGKCIKEIDKLVNVYPIWLCPFTLPNNPGFLRSKADLYVDIGVYGVPKDRNFSPEKTTRQLEDFVQKSNGFQMLYADTYRTEKEFREMFDHSFSDQVRLKYDCRPAFPEIYEKVSKKARY